MKLSKREAEIYELMLQSETKQWKLKELAEFIYSGSELPRNWHVRVADTMRRLRAKSQVYDLKVVKSNPMGPGEWSVYELCREHESTIQKERQRPSPSSEPTKGARNGPDERSDDHGRRSE